MSKEEARLPVMGHQKKKQLQVSLSPRQKCHLLAGAEKNTEKHETKQQNQGCYFIKGHITDININSE